jgi:hypothetical protein
LPALVLLRKPLFGLAKLRQQPERYAVFVIEFAVQEKAVFFIKGTDTFIMFNIRVYREKGISKLLEEFPYI